MSAAMLMQAWGDTMLTTALLVVAVLLIRKPFARLFGPGLTYALWAIPALRFVLPPLPFADPATVPAATPAVPADAVAIEMADAAHAMMTPATMPQASWTFADALPLLFLLWLAGAFVVLARAGLAYRRFKAEVLARGVDLEPLGSIRLVMTDAVDGPAAFGLVRRFVAVPRDFFARYAADERALAIDHELAHHRHGDLWANVAALLLLAAQWFNPLAWRALRAFRFDQEAACDARVLTMAEAAGQRRDRTASYATAIAKAAVGSRLALAAPMASHDNLQERLTMLMQKDISRRRGLAGRFLVGGAALAALAATATLVPAATAQASAQADDMPVPPAPPAPPLADLPPPPAPPAPPEAAEGAHRVMIFTSEGDGEDGKADGRRREVTRVVVREGEGGEDGTPGARRFEFRVPGGLSRDDILSTLKEQGVTGARAEAIADQLEAKRRKSFRTAMAPLPPMPPMPPIPPAAWTSADGKAMAFAHCGPGQKPMPLVDRDDSDGKTRSRVLMLRCGDSPDLSGQLSALRKARDRFAKGEASGHMSAEMRAKVVADMDRAIADLEREKK